jgi:DNA-binding XRE family transcriptional regulator
MPNIVTVLREEISRVARREVRNETLALKKASAKYRTDVAALKRRVTGLEKLVTRLSRHSMAKAVSTITDSPVGKFRFSARSLIAQRRRLGLTQTAVAKLLGVSAQSVYKWEAGKARPRASQFAAIATLRGMSKSQAAARLSR